MYRMGEAREKAIFRVHGSADEGLWYKHNINDCIRSIPLVCDLQKASPAYAGLESLF